MKLEIFAKAFFLSSQLVISTGVIVVLIMVLSGNWMELSEHLNFLEGIITNVVK